MDNKVLNWLAANWLALAGLALAFVGFLRAGRAMHLSHAALVTIKLDGLPTIDEIGLGTTRLTIHNTGPGVATHVKVTIRETWEWTRLRQRRWPWRTTASPTASASTPRSRSASPGGPTTCRGSHFDGGMERAASRYTQTHPSRASTRERSPSSPETETATVLPWGRGGGTSGRESGGITRDTARGRQSLDHPV